MRQPLPRGALRGSPYGPAGLRWLDAFIGEKLVAHGDRPEDVDAVADGSDLLRCHELERRVRFGGPGAAIRGTPHKAVVTAVVALTGQRPVAHGNEAVHNGRHRRYFEGAGGRKVDDRLPPCATRGRRG